jgi:hypothetical protein
LVIHTTENIRWFVIIFYYKKKCPLKSIEQLYELLFKTTFYNRNGPEAGDIASFDEYFMGLRYELLGIDQEAIRVYWDVWNNNPSDPVGVATRYRLKFVGN